MLELELLYVKIPCFCNVGTEKETVYRKTGNGKSLLGGNGTLIFRVKIACSHKQYWRD